jgi:hypothetical protein
LHGSIPPGFFPEQGLSVSGFLYELPILKVGHRVPINIIGIQGNAADGHFGHKNRVLPLIHDEYALKLLLGDSHCEQPLCNQDHLGAVCR